MKKKSLIDNLKSTKKANLAATPAKNEGTSTRNVKMLRSIKKTEFARHARVV